MPALAEALNRLVADNKKMIHQMRAAHELCGQHNDVATASILENFIDQAEPRNWFMFEASRKA
jgi:starvation-inducible DNA-binding protein